MLEHTIPTSPSVDFWEADPILPALLREGLPPAVWERALPELAAMGRRAGLEAVPLAAIADRITPRLVTHDPQGRRIDAVEYHPAYRRMEEIAYGGGCVAVKYEPGDMRPYRHRVGFALTFLFCEAEAGLTCPVCMTDGVARVIEKFGSESQKERFIPRLASRDLKRLARGAMFLTEKQGGSDVGATATVARPSGSSWKLEGEKWFCSNVDAELILTLARPEGAPAGTKGLGLFLLARDRPDGTRNAFRIDRLKDKLGVRSMPTGEVTLLGADAELVGEPGRGFQMMAEMLNLSRLYNAICACSVLRRATFEARSYVSGRMAFGKAVIEHPLARAALGAVEATAIGLGLTVCRTVELLDLADGGDVHAADLVRTLTPLVKYTTAKAAVAGVSECLELHGGQGYIEESVMPRLLRDAQVLPIWEGTTNILVLDTFRALRRPGALDAVIGLIRESREHAEAPERAEIDKRVDEIHRDVSQVLAGTYPEENLRSVSDHLMRTLTLAELCRARRIADLGGLVSYAIERL